MIGRIERKREIDMFSQLILFGKIYEITKQSHGESIKATHALLPKYSIFVMEVHPWTLTPLEEITEELMTI